MHGAGGPVNRCVDPMTTVRSATYWLAVAMDVEKEVRTVSPGKYADVIAVRPDVLRNVGLLQSMSIIVHPGDAVHVTASVEHRDRADR